MEENRSANVEIPGKAEAIVSLVLGILSLCLCLTRPWLSLILGIVGLVFAHIAKRRGYRNGIRTGGFVTSLLGVILSCLLGIVLVAAGGFLVAVGTGMLSEVLDGILL